MYLGFSLAFFVLLHHVPRLSGDYNDSICPENIACQNLFHTFFSNTSKPYSCGLCMVICDTSLKIKLDPWSNQVFDVLEALESSVIKLRDPVFQKLLHGHDCNSFIYDIHIPKLASISYTIVSNITLFKCRKNPYFSREIARHFRGYQKNEPCGDFEIYDSVPKSSVPHIPTDDDLPFGCSNVHLPVNPRAKVSNDSNLFDILTADFDLKWHPQDDCNELCHLEGGQFKEPNISKYFCGKDEIRRNNNSGQGWDPSGQDWNPSRQGKKNLKIIIGTSIAGGTLLAVLAIFLVFHKKGEGIKDALFFHSRNSLEPSSKLDLDGGSSVYFGVPVFSYGELEEVTNNFAVSKELGSGGFGTVYYGKLRDGREVAVKRLYEHNFKSVAQFMNEVEILTRLGHPNLVALYGCTSRRARELLLVYEYIPNGTVADHIHGDRAKDQSLTWPARMNIATETAGALAYLHASDIIHRDVKTNNILLDHNFQVKVADFGLSRLFPNDVSHISTGPQGTPGYVDPEYHQCYQLTDKSDVYSFGVVLIELISSMPAVDMGRHRHEINLANLAINRIQRRAFNELIDLSLGYESDPQVMRMTTSVAELAFQCLQLEKEMRPTMDEVLETLNEIQDCSKNFVEMTGSV